MNDEEKRETQAAFDDAVNMTPAEMERWLNTPESEDVGFTHEGETEAVGHKSGRKIIEIKRSKQSDLNDEDYAHMKRVIGYIHRHIAQGGPSQGKANSRWRYSLMNWGHDPLKD
jgi:hypothetical protein